MNHYTVYLYYEINIILHSNYKKKFCFSSLSIHFNKCRNQIKSKILEEMMDMPACHMHGPEHHTMVGSALLTAYKNAGGEIDLKASLYEMQRRGKQVPGGACGFWGACGAGISTGMYLSIALNATPLAKEAWGLSNQLTARALDAIGRNGGPRCCKRDSYLAIIEAVRFTKENLGILFYACHSRNILEGRKNKHL